MRLQILLSISCIALLFSKQSISQDRIDVAENTFKVGGMGQESFYYGFAEGDQVIFSFEEANGKELKEIEIIEYPTSSKFMDYKTKKISDKIVNIQQTGIYQFRFVNSSISGRVCKYKIQRIPASAITKNFNTSVYWQTIYDTAYKTVQEKYLKRQEHVPKQVIPPTEFYLDEERNASRITGKSRITIPFTLPKNTVEWYYQFSAFRDKEQLAESKSNFDLLGNLINIFDKTKLISFALSQMNEPPGADICDIYLLNHENRTLFESKASFSHFTIGSRENIKSGIIKIDQNVSGTSYIGIRNPNSEYGISGLIEVVAIVNEEEWDIKDVEKIEIKSTKVPYLKILNQ